MFEKLSKQLNLERVIQSVLYLFLFLLPWQTIWIYREASINGYKWQYGTLGFYGTEILLWVVIILFVVWFVQRNKEQGIRNKFQITKDRIFVFSLLLFIIYHLSSIIWAGDKDLALNQSLHVMEGVLLFLVIFIGKFDINKLVKWFLLGSILPCLLGVWQFLTQSSIASTWLGLASHPGFEAGSSIVSNSLGRWLRAYGTFNHPNVFGGYLAIVIVMFLRNKEKGVRSNLLLIPYSLFLISLFFTFSRSAWLATALGILIFIIFLIKNKFQSTALKIIGLTLTIFVIFVSLFSSLVITRVPQRSLANSSVNEIQSIEERTEYYSEAWALFKKHPVLGVGAGNYTFALYQLDQTKLGYEYQSVHNVLALFVVEEGIVGIILVIFILISVIRLRSKEKGVSLKFLDRYYIITFSLFLIPLLFFDHYLYSSYIGIILSAIFFGLFFKRSALETN